MGSDRTPFVRKFGKQHMYREIYLDDIPTVRRMMGQLGDPVRTSDSDAFEETNHALAFLDRWSARDDVVMIIADEI